METVSYRWKTLDSSSQEKYTTVNYKLHKSEFKQYNLSDYTVSLGKSEGLLLVEPNLIFNNNRYTKFMMVINTYHLPVNARIPIGVWYKKTNPLSVVPGLLPNPVDNIIEVYFRNINNEIIFSGQFIYNEPASDGGLLRDTEDFYLQYLYTEFDEDLYNGEIDIQNINLQQKQIEITNNGVEYVEPDVGYQGLGDVEIVTNVEPNLQGPVSYTVTGNQPPITFLPEEGYDGLSEVNVFTEIPLQDEKQISFTPNMTWQQGIVSPDQGFTAMKRCRVRVNPINNQVSKTVDITSNGSISVTPDSGYYGIGTVNINTNVPTGTNIQNDKTVTITPMQNAYTQIIQPDTGYDALGEVTVQLYGMNLVENQTIMTITENGEHLLPQIEEGPQTIKGFADSCKINVNVPFPSIRYISLANQITALGTIDFNTYIFDVANEATNVNINPGKTLIVIRTGNNVNTNIHSLYIGAIKNDSDVDVSALVSNGEFYTILNYQGGQYMYVLDDNGQYYMAGAFVSNAIRNMYFNYRHFKLYDIIINNNQ